MATMDSSLAEALSRAHAALLEDLTRLEEAARPTSGEGLAELRARLDATRAHLDEHFRFEEHDGYMDAVRKWEPRLERAIQQLAEEHRQLERLLAMLLKDARVATDRDARLQEEVRQWTQAVRQHESRENDLIQTAFNLDIGAED
jgi:hypothetical protein